MAGKEKKKNQRIRDEKSLSSKRLVKTRIRKIKEKKKKLV